MTDDRKTLGQECETAAAHFLRRKGYKIIHRNFRNSLGEIDIVARHKGVLVFVEVKARRSLDYGHPKWAITPAKQRKLSQVALAYLKSQGSTQTKARFDVVTVVSAAQGPNIEVIANAFELAYP
jgi:putative endonuclease